MDLTPIVDFLNLVEAHDQVDEGSSVEELRTDFTEPGFDPSRDVRLVEDEEGRLVGFGELWAAGQSADNDGFLWFKVHPELRGAVEPELFAWAEAQLRARGRAALRVAARDIEAGRAQLIEQHGFRPVRYFLRMARPLEEPIPEAVFPAGYTLRAGNHDPQAWAEMYNESFVDHFNFHAHDAAWVRHWQQDPEDRPELNLVAVAPDGTLAAFAWCSVRAAENARTGRRDGWVGLLGTRRGHRRIGLGRAMLLSALQRIKAAGMDTALLGVDASSPTGATRLYEVAGFRTVYSRTLYSRDIHPT
ncbi:MAG TPA: GNAT family N-acetyltransferase [Roseiflexaceae bacterium]|nr:GNAT family N-acetyltransferase [Roseiflexaceae bacterium]